MRIINQDRLKNYSDVTADIELSWSYIYINKDIAAKFQTNERAEEVFAEIINEQKRNANVYYLPKN